MHILYMHILLIEYIYSLLLLTLVLLLLLFFFVFENKKEELKYKIRFCFFI
jgi:hypothetical protein